MDKHNFAPGKITKCQICGSKNLINIMTLGNQPLANSLVKNANNENEIKKFPINIIRCKDCTLLQIDYVVNGMMRLINMFQIMT